jgi:hypothetical protein
LQWPPPEATEPEAGLDVFVFVKRRAGGSQHQPGHRRAGGHLAPENTWSVYVRATPGGDSDYTLYSWTVPFEDGSLVVDSAPTSATANETGTVSVSWSGLEPGTQYLGAVSHSDENGILDLTLVNVDTR